MNERNIWAKAATKSLKIAEADVALQPPFRKLSREMMGRPGIANENATEKYGG